MQLIWKKDKSRLVSWFRLGLIVTWLALGLGIACTSNSTDNKPTAKSAPLQDEVKSNAQGDTAGHAAGSASLDSLTGVTDHNTTAPRSAKTENQQEAFAEFYGRLTAALDKGDAKGLQPFIHPAHGVILIDRPGAIDKIDSARNADELLSPGSKKIYKAWQRLQGLGCRLDFKPMPVANCEGKYTGCRAQNTTTYNRVSELHAALSKLGFTKGQPVPSLSHIRQLEKMVVWEAANLDKTVSFAFFEEGGRWYLAAIDFSRYSCSA